MNHHLVGTAEQITNGLRDALDQSQKLADDNKALAREIDRLMSENDLLRDQLAKAEHARDFYQRHSMRLVTRLSDIGLVIDQAMQEAKDAAYAPSLAVPPANTNAALTAVETALDTIGKCGMDEADIPTFLKNGPAIS